MSHRLPAVLAIVASSLGAAVSTADEEMLFVERRAQARSSPPWREGQLIVAFRDGVDERGVDLALRSGGVRSARASRTPRRFLAQLEAGVSVGDSVQRLSRLPEVLYAEPNGIVRYSQSTFSPNDTFYPFQWNLRQLNAERTWAIQQGIATVAVAVLDTGVAYEDYFDPVTRQSFRKAPDWGDTQFLPGWDFVNGDAHPNDDEYHGTHVASTIAEAANNALGLAGLAFGCSIMPVKVLDANGEGTFFDVAEGIDFAAEYRDGARRPVKVINLSLGSEFESETLKAAIDRATAAGVLVVAAAGNEGVGRVEFPARLPNVVAVGALDALRQRASYSNTGPELDFVAPGGSCAVDLDGDGRRDCVWQQMPHPDYLAVGRYDQFCYCGISGTSMATPHVAAAAALLFSQGFTDAGAVRKALEQTAERLGGAAADGRNDTFGYGLVRPAMALPGMGPNLGPRQ